MQTGLNPFPYFNFRQFGDENSESDTEERTEQVYKLDIEALTLQSEKLFHKYKFMTSSWKYDGIPFGERFNRIEAVTKKFEFYDYYMQFDLPQLNQRFSDIHCLKNGRVTPYTYNVFIGEDTFGNPLEKPIKMQTSFQQHANFVHLCGLSSICSQYPSINEKEGFWNTVINYGKLIVDLTKNGESSPFHPPFSYPTLNSPHKLYKREVVFSSSELLSEHLIKTTYKVFDTSIKDLKKSSEDLAYDRECEVIRLHYQAWQDQSGVDVVSLDQLTNEILNAYKALNTTLPPTIHCLAGVGRTGTVFICKVLKELIRRNEVTKDNYLPMIDALILTGRYQRGNYFVQKSTQYEAIVNLVKKNLKI